MSEQLPKMPPYAQQFFDYYLGRPHDAKKRAEYERRGLIPTNNLSLLIVDEPATEIVPGTGIANPYDYRRKPYGHLIEALKVEQPELWEQAKEAAATSSALMNLYWNAASKNGGAEDAETQAIAAQCEAAQWTKAEVYTQVIQILAPQMEAEGLDPLQLSV